MSIISVTCQILSPETIGRTEGKPPNESKPNEDITWNKTQVSILYSFVLLQEIVEFRLLLSLNVRKVFPFTLRTRVYGRICHLL